MLLDERISQLIGWIYEAAFDDGATVFCEWTTFANGQKGLLAVRLAD